MGAGWNELTTNLGGQFFYYTTAQPISNFGHFFLIKHVTYQVLLFHAPDAILNVFNHHFFLPFN